MQGHFSFHFFSFCRTIIKRTCSFYCAVCVVIRPKCWRILRLAPTTEPFPSPNCLLFYMVLLSHGSDFFKNYSLRVSYSVFLLYSPLSQLPKSTPPYRPIQLPTLKTKNRPSIKTNLCCPNTIGCVVIHWRKLLLSLRLTHANTARCGILCSAPLSVLVSGLV